MDLTGVTGEWLLSGKGDMYGKEEKKITKEEAIETLYGDKADGLILYLIEAIRDPYLRAILYTRANEYKEQQKKWCIGIIGFHVLVVKSKAANGHRRRRLFAQKAPLEYAPEKMYFMETGCPILKVGGRNPQ